MVPKVALKADTPTGTSARGDQAPTALRTFKKTLVLQPVAALLVADQEAAGWSAWTPEMPLLPGAPLRQGKPRAEPQRGRLQLEEQGSRGVTGRDRQTPEFLVPPRSHRNTVSLSASRALPSPGPSRDRGLQGALSRQPPRLQIEFLWRWPRCGGNPAGPQAPCSSAFSPSLGWQGRAVPLMCPGPGRPQGWLSGGCRGDPSLHLLPVCLRTGPCVQLG